MKILIIGTGPAGYSVLSCLIKQKKLKNSSFTVVDRGVKPIRPQISERMKISEYYNNIYNNLKSDSKFKFPPPKTHFSTHIPKYLVGNTPSIINSSVIGGLSNYWGATLLPFTNNELSSWPIKFDNLKEYYGKIANIVGISGRGDELNDYFTDDYVSKPPIHIPQVLLNLNDAVNSSVKDNNFKIISGVNRCAVETRSEKSNCCINCGECMNGCIKNSIFSTFEGVMQILEDPRVELIKGKVVQISNKMDAIIEDDTEKFKISGYDKIYLAAGCPSTSEIIMRSTGVYNLNEMNDNSVCVFPIIYTKKLFNMDPEFYVSLNNLIMGVIPQKSGLKYAQVLLYLNFDYLWRYNMPEYVWKILRKTVRYSRQRVFWGRLYLHGNYSQSYNISLKNDKMVFSNGKQANKQMIHQIMNSIRKAVNRDGFFIPELPPVIQKSSSHYSSTIPYNSKIFRLKKNGEIFPNVYLCDSTVFPDLPAVSLSFTIMANAYRTAAESMLD